MKAEDLRKVVVAPELREYAKHFGEMFKRRYGVQVTEEETVAAFIRALHTNGDILIEELDSSTIRISAPSIKEEADSSEKN